MQIGGIGDHGEHVAVVDHVFRTGVAGLLEQVVEVDALARNLDLALTLEVEADGTAGGQRAVALGQGGTDFGGGAVAVVGQALDDQADAGRRVALVYDVLVVGATGFFTRAALDGALDVVGRHGRFLGLVDGVVQRRVAIRVAAAHTGRDLDVLDELGEELAALGVNGGLLVLGSRPLGMP